MPVISIPKNILIIGTKLPWIFSEKNTQGFLNCPEEINKRQERTCPKEVSMDPISITIFWVILGFYTIMYILPLIYYAILCFISIFLLALHFTLLAFVVCFIWPLLLLFMPFTGVDSFVRNIKKTSSFFMSPLSLMDKLPEAETECDEESDGAMIQKYEMYKAITNNKIKKIHL